MPQSSYSNKDLVRFMRKPLGIEIEQRAPESRTPYDDDYGDEPSIDELLAGAHQSLDSATALSKRENTANLLSIPGRLAGLAQGKNERSLSRFARNFTEPAANVGNTLQLASIPASLAGPEVSGPMYGAGRLLALPDVARRAIAPIDDETRSGAAMEGALYFAPELLRGAKQGVKAAAAPIQARRAVKAQTAARASGPSRFAAARASGQVGGARQGPVAGPASTTLRTQQKAMNPSKALDVAEDVTGENVGSFGIGDVERTIGQSFKGDKPQASALTRLLRGGEQGRNIRAGQQTATKNASLQREVEGLDLTRVAHIARDVANETGTPVRQIVADYIKSLPKAQRAMVEQRMAPVLDAIDGPAASAARPYKSIQRPAGGWPAKAKNPDPNFNGGVGDPMLAGSGKSAVRVPGSADTLLDEMLASNPENPLLKLLRQRRAGGDPYNTVVGPGATR